jgi:hypothetical protein
MFIYADFYSWSGIDTFFEHLKELTKIAQQLNSGCQNSILFPVEASTILIMMVNCSDIQGKFFHDKP